MFLQGNGRVIKICKIDHPVCTPIGYNCAFCPRNGDWPTVFGSLENFKGDFRVSRELADEGVCPETGGRHCGSWFARRDSLEEWYRLRWLCAAQQPNLRYCRQSRQPSPTPKL
eukprot:6179493-Pleurochrysis_carterae.AAC.5